MLNVIMMSVIMLNVTKLNVIMLNVIMLNVIMLNVIMLNVIMQNVIMLSVVAPYYSTNCFLHFPKSQFSHFTSLSLIILGFSAELSVSMELCSLSSTKICS